MWFVKISTRMVKYKSRIIKPNPELVHFTFLNKQIDSDLKIKLHGKRLSEIDSVKYLELKFTAV